MASPLVRLQRYKRVDHFETVLRPGHVNGEYRLKSARPVLQAYVIRSRSYELSRIESCAYGSHLDPRTLTITAGQGSVDLDGQQRTCAKPP